jgi:hypothetical protein
MWGLALQWSRQRPPTCLTPRLEHGERMVLVSQVPQLSHHRSVFLQNCNNNGRRCGVSWNFGLPCLQYRPGNEETFGTDVKFCYDLISEPPHISCNISRDIWNSSRHFKIYICLFHDFSRSPGWKKSALYAESRASVFIWKIFDSSGWMGSITAYRPFLARSAFSAPLRAENVIKGIGAFVIY